MNTNLTFKERAELSMESLKKQGSVTLEQARAQAKWLKDNSKSNNKKAE